jgi:hypothetical protein
MSQTLLVEDAPEIRVLITHRLVKRNFNLVHACDTEIN